MNEKERIQRAYENMLNERAEEKTIDKYLSSLDAIEEINDLIDEKWAKDVDIKSTGEHADKTVAQIKKEIEALKGKAGNKEKMGELLFALRSKTGWKKGKGAAGIGESYLNEAKKGGKKESEELNEKENPDAKYSKAVKDMNQAYSKFHNVYRKSLDTMISNRTEKTGSVTYKLHRDEIVDAVTKLDTLLTQHDRMVNRK